LRRLLSVVAALFLVIAMSGVTTAATGPIYVAPLNGDDERPQRETRARGVAMFMVSADGSEIVYQLNAANIENVVQSHIHLGGTEDIGPVVTFLFGPVPADGGRFSGVLSRGTITASDLIGPLAGHPLSDLLDAIESGNAYVNVHTSDGVAPPDTGPGDFPGGEIRGQL
jgi:hypothetical protein